MNSLSQRFSLNQTLAIAIIMATSVVGRIGIHWLATTSAVGVYLGSIDIIGIPRSLALSKV